MKWSVMIICDVASKLLLPNDLDHKKKLPYGIFFLHPNFYGLNTFYMVSHMINMGHFMHFNYEKTEKIK